MYEVINDRDLYRKTNFLLNLCIYSAISWLTDQICVWRGVLSTNSSVTADGVIHRQSGEAVGGQGGGGRDGSHCHRWSRPHQGWFSLLCTHVGNEVERQGYAK